MSIKRLGQMPPHKAFSFLFFSLKGRISRLPFLIGNIVTLSIMFGIRYSPNKDLTEGQKLLLIVPLVTGIAIWIKRAHDRNRTWLFLLLGVIPVIGLWPSIELFFFRGTVGENRFGEDPLQ